MNAKEFFYNVKAMREAQRNYFKFRTKQHLEQSKQLERVIDEEIKRVERVKLDQQQPRLDL